MGIVLSLFAGRLMQLQGLEASAYASEAEQGRLTTVTLPATRGTISDASGIAFATTVEARDVTADQQLVAEGSLGPRGTAEVLAPLLDLDVDELTTTLTGDRRFVYLAKEVTPQVWRSISEERLPGIFSEKTSKRVYPAGALAANVVGFVGADGAGLGGLEYALDDVLAGVSGHATYEAAGGRRLAGSRAAVEPVPGRDVSLTLDRDIQYIAQNAITRQVETYGAESGTVVVIEVGTGKVRALATAPTFDPNDPGASPEQDRGNRALTEAYEPGSTGKVLTAAAVIEEGAVAPDDVLEVPNRLQRGGKSFKDWEDHATLQLTYTGTLARSSNIGTILAAEQMGLEKLHPYLQAFGIGQETGLALPGEQPGSLPAVENWSATTGYTLAFGQGYSVNSVQMANAIATIAGGGVYVAPSLVEAVGDADGEMAPVPAPETRRVVSEETADTVTLMMEAVTGEGGTAPSARIPGYRVAGKTGTAQRFNPDCGCYRGFTMSFMGFAPADDPAYVVAVALQDPTSGSGGGSTGGPVFAEIMSFALQKGRVPPTGAQPPEQRITADG
jgi:cell division protein FtsI (penicillin-binding protein 3)